MFSQLAALIEDSKRQRFAVVAGVLAELGKKLKVKGGVGQSWWGSKWDDGIPHSHSPRQPRRLKQVKQYELRLYHDHSAYIRLITAVAYALRSV